MHKDLITAEEARQLFSYNPDTGQLFRGGKTLREITCRDRYGYIVLGVRYKTIRAHRLVWLLHYGKWPVNFIDHVNGNPSDNRIENLREASYAENNRNRSINRKNTSGFKGVTYDKSRRNWTAKITVGNKTSNLGRFPTPEEAHSAYCAAARKLHGEFARLV